MKQKAGDLVIVAVVVALLGLLVLRHSAQPLVIPAPNQPAPVIVPQPYYPHPYPWWWWLRPWHW